MMRIAFAATLAVAVSTAFLLSTKPGMASSLAEVREALKKTPNQVQRLYEKNASGWLLSREDFIRRDGWKSVDHKSGHTISTDGATLTIEMKGEVPVKHPLQPGIKEMFQPLDAVSMIHAETVKDVKSEKIKWKGRDVNRFRLRHEFVIEDGPIEKRTTLLYADAATDLPLREEVLTEDESDVEMYIEWDYGTSASTAKTLEAASEAREVDREQRPVIKDKKQAKPLESKRNQLKVDPLELKPPTIKLRTQSPEPKPLDAPRLKLKDKTPGLELKAPKLELKPDRLKLKKEKPPKHPQPKAAE